MKTGLSHVLTDILKSRKDASLLLDIFNIDKNNKAS